MEEWKYINGWEGVYQVSSYGRVKRIYTKGEKILKTEVKKDGYVRVSLSRKCKITREYVHRLVASTFTEQCGRKWGKRNEVDHIDGNHQNNCATNLRWCTHKENIEYRDSAKEEEIIKK